jgi:hypothetical protein
MSKLIIRTAAAVAAVGAVAMSAQAAPLGGVAGDVKATANQPTAVEKAAYRRCWWRYGARHCRWYYGYNDGGYDYGPVYGYGPDIGLFFGGGGGGHFRGGHGGGRGGHHR